MNTRVLLCSVVVGVILLSGCVQEPASHPRPTLTGSPGAIPEASPEIIASPAVPSLAPARDPQGGELRLFPGGTYHTGDQILISVSTNLAPGNEVLIEVYSRSFGPTDKRDGSWFSGISAVVVVEEGPSGGANILRYELDTTGFAPDEYQVVISGITVPAFLETATFTLLPAG